MLTMEVMQTALILMNRAPIKGEEAKNVAHAILVFEATISEMIEEVKKENSKEKDS